MSNSNYKQLSETELRKYIKSHPQDEDAFQYSLSQIGEIRNIPNSELRTPNSELRT